MGRYKFILVASILVVVLAVVLWRSNQTQKPALETFQKISFLPQSRGPANQNSHPHQRPSAILYELKENVSDSEADAFKATASKYDFKITGKLVNQKVKFATAQNIHPG